MACLPADVLLQGGMTPLAIASDLKDTEQCKVRVP
jgi:hypothetical protein